MTIKSEKQREMQGLLCVFIAAVLWSTLTIFVKYIDINPFLFCALRSFLAGLILLPAIFRGNICFDRQFWFFVLSYCSLNIGFVISLLYTSTSIAIGMQFTASLWIFLVGLLRGKRLPLIHMIPLALLLLGVLVFMLTPGKGTTLFGNLVALVSGITFAILTVSSNKAGQKNPLGLTCYGNLCSSAIMFAVFFLTGGEVSVLLDFPTSYWLGIVFLGIFQTAGGFAFLNLGLKNTPPQKASIISTAELVFGLIWVALLYQEYPDIYGLLGVILIMSGIVGELLVTKYSYDHSKETVAVKQSDNRVAVRH